MAQVITISTWLLTRFSITVQRLKGLLWGCALSTRYRRHAVVLLAGICSNYQFKGIPPIRKNSAHHKIKKHIISFFVLLTLPTFISLLESESYSTTSAILKPAKMFAIAVEPHLKVT